MREPQQQPRQPEQQQRIPVGPALSEGVKRHRAWNRLVQGPGERGDGSPGSVPVPSVSERRTDGRICALGPGGSGRPKADGPIRLVLGSEYNALPSARLLWRLRPCA